MELDARRRQADEDRADAERQAKEEERKREQKEKDLAKLKKEMQNSQLRPKKPTATDPKSIEKEKAKAAIEAEK